MWSWVPLERPQVMQPLGRFPAFYGTRRFTTDFTKALHLYLSWDFFTKNPLRSEDLLTNLFLEWTVVSPTPNPQAGGPPLVVCPRLFIQYIHSWSPMLVAVPSIRKPEDEPCCGDKGTHLIWMSKHRVLKYKVWNYRVSTMKRPNFILFSESKK
jgi:hypothetical protein